VNPKEVSEPHFPGLVESKTSNINMDRTSKDLDTDICTLELILNAFKQKSYEDNVITFCRPVYSLAIQAKDQIQEGMTLTGINIFHLFQVLASSEVQLRQKLFVQMSVSFIFTLEYLYLLTLIPLSGVGTTCFSSCCDKYSAIIFTRTLLETGAGANDRKCSRDQRLNVPFEARERSR
jgi:hypothetical protein